jgi:hypothetical protein
MSDDKTTATSEYSYVKSIKTPGNMGISGKGTLSQMTKNVSGLINYIDLLASGNSKASKTGNPLGNKFFVRTGSTCKNVDTGDSEDRFIYINNKPSGKLPILSQLGIKSNSLRGLIPGILENANALDPSTIVNSLSGGLTPECMEVELETINKDNRKNKEKRFVSIQDIENMDACDFGGSSRNPVTRKKCGEGFSLIENTCISKKNTKAESLNPFPDSFENSSPFYEYKKVVTKKEKRKKGMLPPEDLLSKLFYYSILGLSTYLGYKLVLKKIKK